MVVFFPSFVETPTGQFHSYIGDTVRNEFLVDPGTADAVLGMIGIHREAYERAQSQDEIKQLMFDDINKLKSYLSGPGMTDTRFKEEVRNQVSKRFQTAVIKSIPTQQWQRFVLKADDAIEFARMKANISNFTTGALYSAYRFDEENLAVIIETSNTVMTLDKQANDGSVRVSNMKGKDNKPMNYSERGYGKIEFNSNWIASDIYLWMRDAGFETDNMTTERIYEMGGTKKAESGAKPVSFREGRRHAIELLQREAQMEAQAEAALREIGVLADVHESMEKSDAKEVGETVYHEETPEVPEQAHPKSDEEKSVSDSEESRADKLDTMLADGIQETFEKKLKAEAALIVAAKDLFPAYIQKFEEFLPFSSSFEMTQQKIWDSFKELRSQPNAKIIEKHLMDAALQRMFLMNKMTAEIQRENASLIRGTAVMKAQLEQSESVSIRLKAENANMSKTISELTLEKEELVAKITENEETLDRFARDFDEVAAMVENLKNERNSLVGFKEENERLKEDLTRKDMVIESTTTSLNTMQNAHKTLTETMGRMEAQLEQMGLQFGTAIREKEELMMQVASLKEEVLAKNRLIESLAQKRVEPKPEPTKEEEPVMEKPTLVQESVEQPAHVGPASAANQESVPAAPVTEPEVVQGNPVANMSVSEANEVLAEKIEEVRSQIPPIPTETLKIQGRIGRDSLRKATERLGKINSNLPSAEQKK